VKPEAFLDYMTKRGPVVLTVAELAGLLNVSQRHIYKLVAENQIPHIRIGGSVRFDSKDIGDWVERMAKAQLPLPGSRKRG
jgi:excisionase family DNA binding protein